MIKNKTTNSMNTTIDDKAKELIRQFSFIEYDQKLGVKLNNPTLHEAAKQCALICVDEIMEAGDNPINGMPDKIILGETLIGGKEFWQKVKEKIQQL